MRTTALQRLSKRQPPTQTTTCSPTHPCRISIATTATHPALSKPCSSLPTSPPKRQRTRFFDLPREIRDNIYSYLFARESSFPVDFASCADCVHERSDYKNTRCFDPDEHCPGIVWHAGEWRKLCAALPSLPVSRQFYHEASELFCSMPFRFTGDLGWIMLYHFLDKLGPQRRNMIKDITVCHPAFSASPDVNPTRQFARLHHEDGPERDWDLRTGDYYNLFDEHMRMFGFGPAIRDPFPDPYHNNTRRVLDHTKLGRCNTLLFWQDYQFEGAAIFLSQARSLQNLTLTLPQYQFPVDQMSFLALLLHPIDRMIWPQGDQLKRSIVHLVSSRHDCADRLRFQPCMSEIQGLQTPLRFREPLGFAFHIPNAIDPDDTSPLPDNCAAYARAAFESAKLAGREVRQEFYDERGHWPVMHGQFCVNKAMCEMLRNDDEPDVWYYCPGNADEAIAHGYLENMIWQKDPRLEGKGYW